jgi:hypothetical protein
VRRARVAAALAVGALAVAPTAATASCPPYSGAASPMEQLAAAKGRPDASIPPLTVTPSTGPAPLTVDVRWLYWPVNDPVKVEVDLDGDGRADVSQAQYPASLEHTYARPGRYDVTAWIHERSGRVERVSVAVDVMVAQAFESDLLARWDTFKARLRAADVPGALECLHSGSRRRYEASLQSLFAGRQTSVDDVFTTLTLVRIWRGTAEFSMERQTSGRAMSYAVRFVIDGDGVWRINAF